MSSTESELLRSSREVYEVIAFRIASTALRQPWQNYLHPDADAVAQALDFLFFAIRNENRVILVDTGFSASTATRRGLSLARHPLDCLRAAGIEASAVNDVIITHLHWDHAGSLDEFPQATLHLQRSELEFATGPCMCEPLLRRPFDTHAVAGTVRALYDGRLKLHEGDAEIAPGITLHRIGGHTKGLQVVRVSTSRGPVVLASDAAHLWQNLLRRNPFPVLIDVPEAMRGFGTLESLAPSIDHIIPGHDPLIARRFPAMEGVSEAMLLHLPPKPADPLDNEAIARGKDCIEGN